MDLVFSIEKSPLPGETLLSSYYETIPGGKGANQAVASKRSLKDAAHSVKFIGNTGNDSFGISLTNHLIQENIDVSDLKKVSIPTGCASICVDKKGENTIVVAAGANGSTKADDVDESLLNSNTYLLLQMEVPFEENWLLIDRAFQKGTSIFLNLAPALPIPEPIFKKVTYLIVNEQESLDLLDILHLPKEDNFVKNASTLSQFSGQTCIITRGKKGYVAAKSMQVWEGKTFKITPVDTTAAGDTFIGAFTTALEEKMSFEEALRFGATASTLTCLKKGAQSSIPIRTDIETALSYVPLAEKKILS